MTTTASVCPAYAPRAALPGACPCEAPDLAVTPDAQPTPHRGNQSAGQRQENCCRFLLANGLRQVSERHFPSSDSENTVSVSVL